MSDRVSEPVSAEPHCETCVCSDPRSLDNFNRRCALIADRVSTAALDRLPPEVRVRVRRHRNGPIGIRWTGWKLSSHNDLVASQLMACLEPDTRYPSQYPSLNRYWAVNVGRLLFPLVIEYRLGDVYDIMDSPRTDEIDAMMDWPDADLEMYFKLHVGPLVNRIGSECAAREARTVGDSVFTAGDHS
jgi:hypothetical protein